ncbi:MAG: Gfo/Idh/MocA family oxidoreductase, partial [Sphaerochaetaceae bacterium]
MNKEMGFGIIGLGMIADIHAKAIASLPGCKFVAGYDVVPGKAKQFCSVRDAKDYSDLSSFLADPSVQIVTITTPSGAHLDVALAAIEAGKHVIIEKPLEVTVERCDRLIEAAQRKGVV